MAIHSSFFTLPPLPEIGADTPLIVACNAFVALQAQCEADVSDSEDDAIQSHLNATFTEMFKHRASTPEGFAARARALASLQDPSCGENGGWPSIMLAGLLADMLGLPASVISAAGEGWL